jgi:hypothetical protein
MVFTLSWLSKTSKLISETNIQNYKYPLPLNIIALRHFIISRSSKIFRRDFLEKKNPRNFYPLRCIELIAQVVAGIAASGKPEDAATYLDENFKALDVAEEVEENLKGEGMEYRIK